MRISPTDEFPPRPPFPPGEPEIPGRPGTVPGPAPHVPAPPPEPGRAWVQQPGQWPDRLYERLLDQRIVMAHGHLDEEQATRLCAQLLTLDAEAGDPIRLEMQNLEASLPAALTVMGVLDTLRAPVTAYCGGLTSGPALGVLAAAARRLAYPSALFALAEPSVGFEGTARAVAAHEEQIQSMLAELYRRIAGAAGRTSEEVRADAERERLLTVDDAIAYGLIDAAAQPRGSGAAGPAGPGQLR